jgi:hypothetical protein
MTPPKITTLQFIVVGLTCSVRGKKLKTQMIIRTRIETVSTKGVNLPIL